MIFEFLLFAAPIAFVGTLAISKLNPPKSEFNDTLVRFRKSQEATRNAPFSNTTELILELLKDKTDWTAKTDKSFLGRWQHVLEHSSGVKLVKEAESGALIVGLADENGIHQYVDVTDAERKALRHEFDAYKTRAKDRKRDELTKAVASRVLSGTAVHPVLGDEGVHRLPSSGDDDLVSAERPVDTSVPATRLDWDPVTKRIVKIGDGDPTELSEALLQRYGFLGDWAKNVGIINFMKNQFNGDQIKVTHVSETGPIWNYTTLKKPERPFPHRLTY